jgi:hypothetical protein
MVIFVAQLILQGFIKAAIPGEYFRVVKPITRFITPVQMKCRYILKEMADIHIQLLPV